MKEHVRKCDPTNHDIFDEEGEGDEELLKTERVCGEHFSAAKESL